MKLSAEEIEEVVREVLLRIQPTKSAKTETRQATNVAGIEIGDRVVATAQISKIEEHTTVRIHGSAIVTPAASDMAAERQIVLERQTVTGPQGYTKLVHAVGQSTQKFAAVLSRQLKLRPMSSWHCVWQTALHLCGRFRLISRIDCRKRCWMLRQIYL